MSSPDSSNPNSDITIIVVDDDVDVLKLVQSILVGEGYHVIPAKTAESAIEAFDRLDRPPDLLLTDVVMPGVSGPMLVDRLLKKEPNLKILFMSGYDERQVVQRYVIERGYRLISKPFTVNNLRSAIQASLKRRDGDGSDPRKGPAN